jgi:N-acetyl-gamma-glutamyl-phosphate reductase
MVRVGVIGASGYAGAEVVRYLLGHPGVEITYLASDTFEGRPLSDAFPCFLGQNLPLCRKWDIDVAADKVDAIIQTRKNGLGMKVAPELLARGKKVVDVPADFRLKDANLYKQFYGTEHSATDLLQEAVYGVSELRASEIAKARLVANPGCYAISSILALAPLVVRKLIDLNTIVIDSKSGVSGAGRSGVDTASLFCEINEGFRAYAVARHRHTPEIEQELSFLGGAPVTLNFTPHLVPMNRGILTTAYANAARETLSTAELVALYREFYEGKPFVVVLDEGAQPNTKNVFGSNFCHIGLVFDQRTRRVIVTCAIDNMGKGAAGGAIQNLNLMFGLPETQGLMTAPVFP